MSGAELAALTALGAFHGVNPGMGWLFAVSFGLQSRSRRAVLAALPPIAVGHAAAIVVALALLRLAGTLVAPRTVALASASLLVAAGGWHLRRRRHPRGFGMRLRPHELALWSFVMASVHGAGLMVLPVVLHAPDAGAGAHPVTGLASAAVVGSSTAAAAATVHSLAMLGAMGGIAVLVYDRFGLAILRRSWINLDLIWAAALLSAGVLALFT